MGSEKQRGVHGNRTESTRGGMRERVEMPAATGEVSAAFQGAVCRVPASSPVRSSFPAFARRCFSLLTRSRGAGDGVPTDAVKPEERHPQPVTGESRERRPETQEHRNTVATEANASLSGVTAGETALRKRVGSDEGRGVAHAGSSWRCLDGAEIGSSWNLHRAHRPAPSAPGRPSSEPTSQGGERVDTTTHPADASTGPGVQAGARPAFGGRRWA